MGKVDFLRKDDFTFASYPGRSRRPFTHAVHCEGSRLFERGRIKCRGSMAKMVLGKEHLFGIRQRLVQLGELAAKHVLLEQFLANPYRHRFAKRLKSARREC